ncbi:IS1341-type transposase [Natrialba chahannaoensis JCM 10990]|uniref:IS1341-type transposase n=1 Tax=Natrialba chahannaoensis JCM 10990 TaxID=1227492 RepID=M0AY20_9EURY|nr:RNA-guided endonuclease TnpB family protein [Natrialba chahannaoensis]ELZ03217.1 IS1341-type transposase [Natrialba chahannaoensis JCM 10990]
MTEVTETLELKLVEPNAHKHQKLCETKTAYQQALEAAFDAGCTTQSAANDVVVNYDLSGYAKNALKKYVPQLCGGSYHAKELHNDHPVRFTNEGVRLDHKPQNAIEWYIKIPHHDDYNLWLPAQPNPEQREWLEALHGGAAKMGECRLFDRDGEWYLHVVATRDVKERPSSASETPIGVDIGEASLLTVCHRNERGSPTTPTLWNDEGKQVRQLRETYFTATRRLQKRGSERIAESYGDSLWRQIDDILHTVTSEVVAYADQFENPVLVLEDLTHIRESMDYGAFMNRRLHGWGFAKMHAQLRYKATEKGIRVETVNPAYTSKSCHCCGERGTRPDQATFKCTNSECWVRKYQADVNAALNIADRYLSGESHHREHTGDNDSAEDGGRLTGPQDSQADAEAQQLTLGTYAS